MTMEERYRYHTRRLLIWHYEEQGWLSSLYVRGKVHYVTLRAFGNFIDENILFSEVPHWKDDNCLKARFNEKSEILGRIIDGQYVKEVK